MKHLLVFIAMISAFPVFADDCFDAGVRFRSFGDTGGSEVYLGQPDLGVGDNRVERNFSWNSNLQPQEKDFVFDYDLSGNASADIPSENIFLNYLTPVPQTIEAAYIFIASRDNDSSVELLNLTINDVIFGDFSTDSTSQFVFPVEPSSFYSVTGTIRYSGAFSNSQELSRVEIRLGEDECDLLPEPEPEPLPEAKPVPVMSHLGIYLMILLFGYIGWNFDRMTGYKKCKR